MPARTPEVPRLVSQPREHYLRQNEGRIRSLALPQNSSDPLVKLHLDAVQMAEDFEQIHESAADGWRALGNKPHRVETHEHHHAAALQFKLYHLDKLAIILI